mmetsp:Transcript_82026/g.265790  ORF Transcript_82026/g.265790 Transcript_82026/m.265790 type:complete len:224 (+) Transcript_82026:45-716(+)
MSTVDPDAVAVFGEEELPVHSLLLRLASPFFEAMFVNKMAESRHRRFDVHIASKDEFQVFYDWLHPVSGRDLAITLGNMDAMLRISNYYQVQSLVDRCVGELRCAPPSAERLILSFNCGLTDLQEHFADSIATAIDDFDLGPLKAHPDLLLDVTSRIQSVFRGQKKRLQEQTAELEDHRSKRIRAEGAKQALRQLQVISFNSCDGIQANTWVDHEVTRIRNML